MFVTSSSLVLSVAEQEFSQDNPSIGWQNLVTVSNISAIDPDTDTSVEDPEYPAINMANPSTYEHFAQLTAGQDFVIDINLSDSVQISNYIGLAGHNLAGCTIQIFGAVEIYQDLPLYVALTQEILPADNRPIMFRYTRTSYRALRIAITNIPADKVASIAVVYCGDLLVCERKVQASFTPLNYGRKPDVMSGMSDRGQFLGRLIVGSSQQSSCNLSFMSPDWYREFFDPFIENAQTEPFFFAWAPVSYPQEVGYAWFMDDMPVPQIMNSIELWQITMEMEGITE